MPINELDPTKCCQVCGGQYDSKSNTFIPRCGNPISAYEYSGKVCYFAKKRGAEGCLNTLENDEPNWDSWQGLDKKSERALVEYGIDEETINYLKLPGKNRY